MKHRHSLPGPLVWLGGHELGTLVAVAALAAGIWAFVALAGEVMEGETQSFDRKLLLAMRDSSDPSQPRGTHAIREAARDVTALGGFTVLTVLILSVGGYFVLDGRSRMGIYIWLSVGSGMLLSTILKALFNRPRPDLVPHAVYVSSSSFPSGHSMLSAVAYLTLGALLARSSEKKRLKAYFLILSIVLTVAVGVSRVYLGVHWPTDVLAGWTAGAVWAALCWIVARWLQRKHTIEAGQQSEVDSGTGAVAWLIAGAENAVR